MRLFQSIAYTFGAAGLLAGAAQAQISFQPATNYPLFGQRPDWVAIADFDRDGDNDLAVTSGDVQGGNLPDWVEIFVNQGNGTFVAGQRINMGMNVGTAAVVACDVDGDDDIDLAVSLKDLNTVQILVNTAGSFSLGGSTPVNGSEPRHMTSGDVDGDGDADLVTSNRNSNNLSILRNDGGFFNFAGTVPTGAEPRYVVLAHLNGDTLVDLAVAANDDRRVEVRFNTGGGSFGASLNLTVPGNEKPSGLVAADIDADGDVDLATTSDNNNAGIVATFRNQGGVFTTQTFPTGGINPGAIVAGDLDFDGDVDLAAADEGANRVSALPNTGGGFFGAAASFPVGTNPNHLAGADLDGDGAMDLVTANRDSNSFSVLLNNAPSLGSTYCVQNPNSTCLPASISARGSNVAAANNVTLMASGMPAGQFGIFITSRFQGFIPTPGISQGNVCLANPIARFNAPSQILSSGATGTFSLTPDLTSIPLTPPVAVMAGQTWNFQAWFRDGASSNFTNGLSIAFQ